MSDAKLVKCQKCGKPLGYITIVPNGFISTQQPIQGTRIVAVCMNCNHAKKFTIP